MATLQVKVIGCGDAFGSGGVHYACFHLQREQCQLLVDCGASALVALKKQRLAADELDYVLISHLHGDHFGGIPFLMLDSLQNARYKPLQIIGPEGLEEKSLQLFDLLYPGSRSKINSEMFLFSVYESEKVFIAAEFELLALPVQHSDATRPHGLKISFADKVIAYSGDSAWCDNLVRLAEAADLMICECCFFDQQVNGHLDYATLLSHQHQLQARLLLTHFDTSMLAALEQVKFECASEGLTLTL